MSVKTGTAVNALFTTSNPSSGAAINADATPTGVLYLNGSANAAAVTVTNIAAGIYKAAVTMPALAAGDTVFLAITATVSGVAGKGVIWSDTGDTAIVSDVKTDTAAILAGIGGTTPEAALTLALKLLRNKRVTNPATGVMTVYDDDNTTVLYTANVYEDVAGTMPFDGGGANRVNRLA